MDSTFAHLFLDGEADRLPPIDSSFGRGLDSIVIGQGSSSPGLAHAIGDIDGGRRWGSGGRGLSSTSFAHLGYMTKLPQALRGGGTTFMMGRWSAGDALEMVERHRITALGGIPTQVALMLRHDSFDSTDTSSVRMIAMGGGPSTAALVREARARFAVPVRTTVAVISARPGPRSMAAALPERKNSSP